MASNAELTAEALELAKALNLDVKTDDLTNKELSELVKDLKAKKKDADTPTSADNAPAATEPETEPAATEPETEPAATEPETEQRNPGYYVAAGKAITSKRGILADGDAVAVKDVAEGKARLDKLVKAGVLEVQK